MPTITSPTFTYDVFISFRGEDTRYGFTGNLYKALRDKGIHTFIDDDKLERGEEITPALMKAIQESRIAITVLSENYASSSFCLDELEAILDCKNKGLLVIPVFYKVDPSDVRHQKGSYGEALTKHQKRFKDKKEKLQKWKMTLRQVADLSGYHFKDGIEYEYKFIGSIVEWVCSEIGRGCCLHVADYPVGLDSRVLEVRKLLEAGCYDGVHMIGIHGMGGVGKSTLARAVYNGLIAENFDSYCFLENVREKSNKHGLEHLQSILISQVLGQEDINLTSKQQGISMIKCRLKRKKILLILDDVDNLGQLRALAGGCDWFGPGSRIIITTRDKQLLATHQVTRTYEVRELNEKDALRLLTLKAFKKEKADLDYELILNRVVTYASGLPLALEVIGSNLFGKSVKEWESATRQYKRIPKKEILEILKASYEALEEEEKVVFLDIACCFKGYALREVEDILGALYDECMKHHIGVLVEKSLIKVSLLNTVEMHDLIENMGRKIDQKESAKEPGNRRRLWLPKDIIQVLKYKMGTGKIEIMCLDFSISENEETIECDENTFMEMENLKILINRNVKFSKVPNYFPESLKVLEWHRYPSNCLPSNFHANKLVICKLPDSCFASFGFHASSKKFENLTSLNFDDCKLLTQIPDVSDLQNLEKLSFEWCESLTVVHNSVGFMTKLKILSAEGCSSLTSFPPLHLTSLERLELSYCSSLENFPEILGNMGNIKRLELVKLAIKELPISFQNLTGLKNLLVRCDFVRLSSIFMTPELSDFKVYNCKGWKWAKAEEGDGQVGSIVSSKLDDFIALSCNLNDDFLSAGFLQLAQVSYLWLQESDITFLPECIKEFHNLHVLDVSDCRLLREIRGIPLNLKHFKAKNCISLTSSGSSVLLNQKLHEAGGTVFIFPGGSVPEWLGKQSKGASISFWFRNKFPAKVLCLLIAPVLGPFDLAIPMVYIDGKIRKSLFHMNKEVKILELDYTHLFDIEDLNFEDDLMGVSAKEWKQVEVTYEGLFDTSVIKATGIHVVKEESRSMEDIRYDDPYSNNKEDNHLNTFQSQNHSLNSIGLMLTLIGSFLLFSCFFFFVVFTSLRSNTT